MYSVLGSIACPGPANWAVPRRPPATDSAWDRQLSTLCRPAWRDRCFPKLPATGRSRLDGGRTPFANQPGTGVEGGSLWWSVRAGYWRAKNSSPHSVNRVTASSKRSSPLSAVASSADPQTPVSVLVLVQLVTAIGPKPNMSTDSNSDRCALVQVSWLSIRAGQVSLARHSRSAPPGRESLGPECASVECITRATTNRQRPHRFKRRRPKEPQSACQFQRLPTKSPAVHARRFLGLGSSQRSQDLPRPLALHT